MSGTLNKPSRRNAKKHLAVNLKPCKPQYDESGQGNDKFFTIYVDAKKNQVERECTAAVFTRIEGRRRDKRPHTGLKKQTATQYLLTEDKQGVVSGIDVIPTQEVLHSMTRDDLEGVERIKVEISDSGEISLLERPQDVTDRTVISLIAEVDKVAELETGQRYGNFEVVAIDGNRVDFEYEDVA